MAGHCPSPRLTHPFPGYVPSTRSRANPGEHALSFEKISNVILTCAAVVLVGVVIRREFFLGAEPLGRERGVEATEVENWRALAPYGEWIGDSSSPVILTEFGDYQCPYCKLFHERLLAIRDSLSAPIGILYIHFPIATHRFAIAAANAATCAAEQGRFDTMHNVLLSQQAAIGLVTWDSLAVLAAVPDRDAFQACHSLTDPKPIVATGLRIADSLGVTYTPTILINQWRYTEPPVDSLRVILQAAIDRLSR